MASPSPHPSCRQRQVLNIVGCADGHRAHRHHPGAQNRGTQNRRTHDRGAYDHGAHKPAPPAKKEER